MIGVNLIFINDQMQLMLRMKEIYFSIYVGNLVLQQLLQIVIMNKLFSSSWWFNFHKKHHPSKCIKRKIWVLDALAIKLLIRFTDYRDLKNIVSRMILTLSEALVECFLSYADISLFHGQEAVAIFSHFPQDFVLFLKYLELE